MPPNLDDLEFVKPGDPVSASHYNRLVAALRSPGSQWGGAKSGYNLGEGTLYTEPIVQAVGGSIGKWVIVREVASAGALTIWCEGAVRHPEYSEEGPNKGRWIPRSEYPEEKSREDPILTEYPVWPHYLGLHYMQYVWPIGTESRIRETQILIALYVGGVFYPMPKPPWVLGERADLEILTPCEPQVR